MAHFLTASVFVFLIAVKAISAHTARSCKDFKPLHHSGCMGGDLKLTIMIDLTVITTLYFVLIGMLARC